MIIAKVKIIKGDSITKCFNHIIPYFSQICNVLFCQTSNDVNFGKRAVSLRNDDRMIIGRGSKI